MDVEVAEQTDFLQDDLVCSVCYAEFIDIEDLELHVKQLHPDETNKSRFCEICTRIFNDVEEYALHLRNTHLSGLKCCKYCTRLFKSSLEVVGHEKKHNVAVLYPKVSCSHCKNIFNTKKEVKDHELKEHSDSTDGFMLRDCFPILSSILCMNIQDFLNRLPYKCVVCDKTTADVNAYIQHLIDDDKCRAYTCNECCNVYGLKSKLRKHILTHVRGSDDTRDFLVQCRKCKLTFKAASLRSHRKRCTGMGCTLCNLSFESITEYTDHTLSEHKQKMLALQVCIYCQKQMVSAVGLKKHIERVHENEKHLYKYHCTHCKRLFKHPKFLFAHFFTKHKDLHPYTCKICDKTFRVRKAFTLHIKLIHKSIGSVQFDKDFHVFFTDTTSKNQTTLENTAVNNKSDYEINDHDYCENSSSFEDKRKVENECKVEIEKITDNYINSHTKQPKTELNKLEIDSKPKDEGVKKSNDEKHKTVEVDAVTDQENVENKNRNENNDGGVTTDCDTFEKPDKKHVRKPVLKRKCKEMKKSQIKDKNDDVSSDDSDVPLQAVSKKLKKTRTGRSIKKRHAHTPKTNKFICEKCDKNCYTYQNYHRHKALHTKNETKVCIKCYENFDSVKKLDEHIKREHSSSQLTETLKKLLEKRKAEAKLKETKSKTAAIPKSDDVITPQQVVLSTTEKFRKTIKKFNSERNLITKVTMKLIDADETSVKKYLENFVPDNNEVRITVVKDSVSLDRVKKRRPLIKLTKFKEPVPESQEGTLKMPVKFTDDLKEQCQVSIKLVSDYVPPAMTFTDSKEEYNLTDNLTENYEENHEENYDYDDTYETYEPEVDNKDVIPEVAQEVMLEGTEVQNTVVHNIQNIPTWHKVQIAHLSTEAPFFKISEVNPEIESSFTLCPQKKQDVEIPKNITLPNGTKLVSVNPFEHLLNEKMKDLLSKKMKDEPKAAKTYYKPKIKNAAEAIKAAMEKLEKSHSIKDKKKV